MNDRPKGTPFQPVTSSYLLLQEIRIDSKKKTLASGFTRIPNELKPVKPPRDRTHLPKSRKGATTKLPKLHYLAALILRNEILGCIGQASDREWLLRNMRKEYRNWSAQKSRRFIGKYSTFRNRFNNGTLYARFPMPSLYAFYWNDKGYIHHPRYTSQPLSFQYCKRELNSSRFCDPRFFTRQEYNLVTMRIAEGDPEYEGWHAPSLTDIHTIESEIEKPLFDSITFPPGYGKEYNPL